MFNRQIPLEAWLSLCHNQGRILQNNEGGGRGQKKACEGFREGQPSEQGQVPDPRRPTLDKGGFSHDDPTQLVAGLWYLLSLNFGFRGNDESRQLRFGDISIAREGQGDTYLELNAERLHPQGLGQWWPEMSSLFLRTVFISQARLPEDPGCSILSKRQLLKAGRGHCLVQGWAHGP